MASVAIRVPAADSEAHGALAAIVIAFSCSFDKFPLISNQAVVGTIKFV